MTWSLALQNGDLQLSGGDLGIVTGEAKLLQDLTCFVLTELGSDPAHPDYGSIILGGQDGSGLIYQSFLTGLNTNANVSQLMNELQRILLAYQNMQLVRAQTDKAVYGKTTFSKGEVLLTVNSITATTNQSTVNLLVSMTTAAGTNIALNVPVS
jgi:hypothetical protein